MINRREVMAGGVSLGLAAAAGPAFAQQDYPSRPMRVLIGFPAGSGADILGRYFATKLGDASGQSVIIENKPGANSNIRHRQGFRPGGIFRADCVRGRSEQGLAA